MADLTQLSDGELQQQIEAARHQSAPGQLDLSHMSDADLQAGIDAARKQAVQGKDKGAVVAAVHGAANTASLGMLDRGVEALDNSGVYKANVDATDAAHPYASITGTATGVLAGGGIAGGLLRGAEAIPGIGRAVSVFGRAISPVKGQGGLNLAKSAAMNAGIGGGVSLAQGDDLATAGRDAAISGAAGPLVESGAAYAAPRMMTAGKQAWAVLAKKFDESPSVIANAVGTHYHLTGEVPSMAEIVNYHTQGQLAALADGNSIIADAALKAKRAGSAPLAEQIAATNATNQPQTYDGLQNWRNMRMDNAVAPVRNNVVTLSPREIDQMTHPKILDAYDRRLHNGLATGVYDPFTDVAGQHAAVMSGATPAMSVGALDTIRQGLAGKVREGADAATYKTLRDNVGKIAEKDNGYKAAMNVYRDDSQYMDGFKLGRGGDSATQGVLSTKGGSDGYEHGNALYRAEQALNAIAPGGVSADGAGATGRAAQLATAGANAVHGSAWTIPHLIRSMPGVRLSSKAQSVIGDQLFSKDPAVVLQAVRNLRRGGGTNETINRLATTMGGAVSVNIANALRSDTGE